MSDCRCCSRHWVLEISFDSGTASNVLFLFIYRAIGHMISILFWPLIPYLMQIGLLAFWGASAVCLAAVPMTGIKACTLYRNSTLLGGNSTDAQQYTDVRCWLSDGLSELPCDITVKRRCCRTHLMLHCQLDLVCSSAGFQNFISEWPVDRLMWRNLLSWTAFADGRQAFRACFYECVFVGRGIRWSLVSMFDAGRLWCVSH